MPGFSSSPPRPKTFAPLYDLVIHAGMTFCHKDYKLENLSDRPLLLSIEQQSEAARDDLVEAAASKNKSSSVG